MHNAITYCYILKNFDSQLPIKIMSAIKNKFTSHSDNFILRIISKITVLMAFIFTLNAAFAETNNRIIEQELGKLIRNPAFIEKILDQYKLEGMPREVLKEHILELYKNNDVLKFLIKEAEIAGFNKFSDENGFNYGRNFGAELFVSYSMKGMSRLSLDDQKFFIKYMLNWMHVASDNDCKKMLVNGGASSSLDDANIEMKYYHRIERETLRSYFYVLRKSIIAEILDYPSSKTINQQQSKIADDAFEKELLSAIDKGLISENSLAAMIDLPNSSPKAACSAGKDIFETILNMKGFGGELYITKFFNSMR